jgi:hypothetical protein
MAAGLQRASIFAIKEEVTAGTYVAPSAATQFIPLRPGNTLNYEPEILENDELLNDIGASKGLIGKESVSGSHSAYLRHSGVEGQEPQIGVLYESIMGSKAVAGTEYDTVASSTTTLLKVDTGEGANFQAGQAVLVKDGSNGYSIRNIASISGDDLTLNFKLSAAPAAGVNLGKAVLYIPAAQGHPTFSTTKYLGNGHAVEASAGNTVTECAIKSDANGFGEVEFSYQGTKYFYNPIIITASNKYLDFEDDAGNQNVTVAEDIYKTPHELAQAVEDAMNAASSQTITCTYSDTTGMFTIAATTGTVLKLEFATGTNTANTIATKLGYTATDKTGATTYTSQSAQTYAAAYSPSYDSADAIVIKGGELFIGSQDKNVCVCAQSVSINVSKEVEDVDCLCEDTGVSEKIPTSRSAEMTVTCTLNKYDAGLLDALLNNTTISAMLNLGPKSGGNWLAGKCFNAYFQNCTVSSYTTTGDNFIQAEITLKGFVTSTQKDLYLNFI